MSDKESPADTNATGEQVNPKGDESLQQPVVTNDKAEQNPGGDAGETEYLSTPSSDMAGKQDALTQGDPVQKKPIPGPSKPLKTDKSKTKHQRRWKVPFAVAAFILAVALVSAFGLDLLHKRQQQRLASQLVDITQRMHDYQSELDGLKSSMADDRQGYRQTLEQLAQGLKTQQTQLQQTTDQQRQQIAQLQQRVDGQQQRLLSLSTTSREDWLLAEAEYLLKLANQRVLLERSPANAIALFAAADKIVQQVAAGLGDAELFAVRQAIAKELTALKLVPQVDKDGLYLQLQALAEQVEALPRVPPTNLRSGGVDDGVAVTEDEQPPGDLPWWRRAGQELAEIAGMLDRYIVFDRVETPKTPLLDSHSAQLAALNVRIAIEQAQVALLKEDDAIYQKALEKAEHIVAQHYYPSAAATQYRASVALLREQTIAPTLPDISLSLQLLHGYLERLHRLQPKVEGQL